MQISIPYGRTHLTADIPDAKILAVLKSRLESYTPPMGERELVEAALAAPIGSPSLEELSRGKKNIVLIASDHTRPVPSRVIMPAMLRELPPVVVYEPEITEEDLYADIEIKGVEGVVISREDDASFRLSGAWVEALVNRVNIFDRESMMYFERSLSKSGLIDRLREAGCQEGDIVKIDDVEFEFVD